MRSKSKKLETITAEGEGRLGTTGNLLQTFGGFNLTAEPNRDLREGVSQDLGFGSYGDLEPFEKRLVSDTITRANNDELRKATETGARRGQDWAKFQKTANDINEDYTRELEQ